MSTIAAPVTAPLAGFGRAEQSIRPTTRLRLTARGRRVLAGVVSLPLAVAIAFAGIAGGSAIASGERATGTSFETITVASGDTLWAIASAVAPGEDPREAMDEIIRLNNLPSGALVSGQRLAIPARYTD